MNHFKFRFFVLLYAF